MSAKLEPISEGILRCFRPSICSKEPFCRSEDLWFIFIYHSLSTLSVTFERNRWAWRKLTSYLRGLSIAIITFSRTKPLICPLVKVFDLLDFSLNIGTQPRDIFVPQTNFQSMPELKVYSLWYCQICLNCLNCQIYALLQN